MSEGVRSILIGVGKPANKSPDSKEDPFLDMETDRYAFLNTGAGSYGPHIGHRHAVSGCRLCNPNADNADISEG